MMDVDAFSRKGIGSNSLRYDDALPVRFDKYSVDLSLGNEKNNFGSYVSNVIRSPNALILHKLNQSRLFISH